MLGKQDLQCQAKLWMKEDPRRPTVHYNGLKHLGMLPQISRETSHENRKPPNWGLWDMERN